MARETQTMTSAGSFGPAVDASPRASAAALAGLRVLVGLMWLYNVAWKRPPDFGESSGSGVYGFTADAVEHPVFPPYSWVVEHVVLPNFTAFGWMVLVVESLLAVLLLTGTFVRFAALVGVGQSLAIGLSVAQTPGEWPWAYWMMIGIHVVLLLTASGKAVAVDRMRADAAAGHGPDAAVPLLRGWGIVVLLTGVLAVVLALGEDPMASAGTQLGGSGLSVSLGSYNLLGAAALLVVAGLMLSAALLRRRALAWAATVIAVLAAASVYAQLSRTEVWLGGSNTSAAYLLCAALVSGAGAAVLARQQPDPDTRRAAHG
ncbi:hypothetical protein BH24ACT12_BH24ACT12_18920 [soil metagenome]